MAIVFEFVMQHVRPEIRNIISTTGVTPTWDKTAAVKYFVWNSNEWVSYNDADTFKQVHSIVRHNSGIITYVPL
jgi:hypothetical protein